MWFHTQLMFNVRANNVHTCRFWWFSVEKSAFLVTIRANLQNSLYERTFVAPEVVGCFHKLQIVSYKLVQNLKGGNVSSWAKTESVWLGHLHLEFCESNLVELRSRALQNRKRVAHRSHVCEEIKAKSPERLAIGCTELFFSRGDW